MTRLAGAALLVLAFVTCGAPWAGSDLASGATASGIRRLRLGMTEAEVTALLGPPLERNADHDGGQICDQGMTNCRAVNPPGELQLVYSRPVMKVRSYPMLWVYLRNGRLREVYAKHYIFWGADDEGLYVLDEGLHWESPGFESAFPR